MSRQLIFFDLDDTLVDHHGAEEAAQRQVHEQYAGFFNAVSFETWLSRYQTANRALWDTYGRGEIGSAELRQRRFFEPLASLGLDVARAEEVGRAYLDAYARCWTLNDGAEEILEEASLHGVVGILSNGFTDIQRAKVRRFRLDRWARHVVLSEEVGAMKPAREIFEAAARAAGEENGRRVYVGDSFPHDVVGAKGAGWLPILFNPDGKPVPAPVLWVSRLGDLKPLLQ